MIYSSNDLSSFVRRLAARAALLSISEKNHPILTQRISEFAQDKGAIGLLVDMYDKNATLEETSLFYWRSRIEQVGSRLEDLIVTGIISVFTSLISGILVELWKGELGPFKRLASTEDQERLRVAARKEPHLRQNLAVIMPFYRAKQIGAGVSDEIVAQKLYSALSNGQTFKSFAEKNPSSIEISDDDILRYAKEVARGVVSTELMRARESMIPRYKLSRNGIPFSPGFGFGEVIFVKSVFQFLSPEMKRNLSAPRLYPELWPPSCRISGPNPKIIILGIGDLSGEAIKYATKILAGCAGIIAPGQGMTSHLAVLCRSLGKVAVGCELTKDEQISARFALLQSGNIELFFDKPSFSSEDFEVLFGETMRLNTATDRYLSD